MGSLSLVTLYYNIQCAYPASKRTDFLCLPRLFFKTFLLRPKQPSILLFFTLQNYKHCKDPTVTGKSPLSIVTAAVDQITLHSPVLADQDVKLCGNVTWAGRTSLEVTMTLEQKQEDTVKKLLEAQFVLVARDPVNKNSAFVNPLQADTADEERIMKLGEANKMKRQEESKRSLLLMAPNENERFLIHKLFLETIDPKAVSFKVRIKPENCVWLSSTMLKNLIICHPEQRNMYNKIFGGFLMRQAYELGWANSFMFSQERCQLNQVDSIIFRKPVEIGALLFFSSQVVYTEGRFIQHESYFCYIGYSKDIILITKII
ncbi:ACOT9 [Acanthosepion pharaonis]|uniref:ACOT9 n=1 Tax=Acanthosepion pharaonis TaxID=158019 RepID=A0A812B352_ACAPH|nr:ACOT9 [Sepia pharaonis]